MIIFLSIYLSGEESQISPRHKPVKVTASAPLDDMALPSGQPIAAATSRRPLSYHPTTSYQMHCATEPRSRNHTTNYFASAAFRAQGHPDQTSDSVPQRNRTSNSLCHERLSALSSEDESESQDEGDSDEAEITAPGNAVFNSGPSQQNGYAVGGADVNAAIDNGSNIDQIKDAASSRGTNVDSDVSDSNKGTRAVTSLLRFTDPGPSFEEFVEQQSQSSENSESSGEEVQDSSIDNSDLVSSEALEQTRADDTDHESSNIDETRVPATTPAETNNTEVPTEAAASSEDEEAEVSNEGGSSYSSTSADDGGDSTEHGYVEIEPGYADGHSDTESQFSDVDEDEIYVGDDIPVDDVEGTVLGDGDLLNECLDMLSAVGYTDIRDREDVRSNEASSSSTKVKQVGDNEASKVKVEQADNASSSKVSAITKSDSRVHIETGNTQTGLASEEAAVVISNPVQEQQDQNIGDVLSVLNNITLHAESLLIKPDQISHSPDESSSVPEVVLEGHLVNEPQNEALANGDKQDCVVEDAEEKGAKPPFPSKERYKELREDYRQSTDKEKRYRNRSYYKAVSDVSPEKETESQKLSKLNSALNAVLSPRGQEKENDLKISGKKEQSDILQGDKATSQHPDLLLIGKHQDQSGEMIGDIPDLSSNNVVKDSLPSGHVKTESNVPESSAFSLRHRIFRDESDSTAVNIAASAPSSSNRHQISDRTDIDNRLDSSYKSGKLKHSVSDPLTKNKPIVKPPLSKRISDQILNFPENSGSKINFDNPIFRNDLPESSVDDIEPSSDGDKTSAVKRKPAVTTSAAVVFDPSKLKDVSVKSMRETAILSSSEDLTTGSSKNKPLARSDQPVAFQEITLSTASSATSAFPFAIERDKRNMPIERTDHAGSDMLDKQSAHLESWRNEKQKPPPLPPRNSSFEAAVQFESRSRGSTVQEPVRAEGIKDPWQNVTVRKEKRAKTVEGSSSITVSTHDSNANKIIPKPEHANKPEPVRNRAHQATTPAVMQTVAQPIVVSSTQLEKNRPGVLQHISRDPTGATRPRISEQRATAIKRTSQDEQSNAPNILPNNKGARPRETPTEPGKRPEIARATGIEHKSRIRSPSEPAQPLLRDRLRSPSEPPIPATNESARPPVIPPRSSRPNQASRGKPAPLKGSVQANLSSPLRPAPVKPKASTSTSTVPSSSRTDVQKRPTNDVSRERRDNNGAPSRVVRDAESVPASTRSPAILHSDGQGRRGDNGSSAKPANQPVSADSDDSLPSRK